MRHIRSEEIKFSKTPGGEGISLLVGRHPKHGHSQTHTIALVQLEVGQSSESHFHKEREESYFFLSGYGEAIVSGQTLEIKAGDLIHTMPGERHQFINIGKEVLRYLIVTAPPWVPEDSWE